MNHRLRQFLRTLQAHRAVDVFNPWAQRNPDDLSGNGPAERRRRLAQHLEAPVMQVLVGEAPGYQGCRITGIPFTSERLLINGAIPRVAHDGARLSSRSIPWSEPSATVLWSTLCDLEIAHNTLLWNVFPWHPHRAGRPYSNRTPTRTECAMGLPILQALLHALPHARLFAVGRHAERALRAVGREAVVLRHPSMGGASEFRRGLQRAMRIEGHKKPRARRRTRPRALRSS